MSSQFSQKNLLSSSLLVLSLFLLSPEGKAMNNKSFFGEHEESIPSIQNTKKLKEICSVSFPKKQIKIPLFFKKMAAQDYKKKNGTLTITTKNDKLAGYQAMTDRVKVTAGEKFQIPYEINVEDGGKMSFGVLNTKGDNWIGGEAIFLEAGSYTGVKEILIPQGESLISLVLRNYHLGTAGQSTFTAKLGLEKEVIQKPKTTSIPLTFRKGAAQDYKESNGTLTITTKNDKLASYQATTNRIKVTPGEKIQIPYEITVETGGKMAFGVLNTKSDGWIGGEAAFLEPRSYTGVKEVMIPKGESEISLVLLNYHLSTPGQSKFTAKLGLEKEEKVLFEKAVDNVSVRKMFHHALLQSGEKRKNAIYQNEGTFFTKDMNGTKRAQIITVLLRSDNIQEIAEGIKKLFPKGVEKISFDAYLECVTECVRNDTRKLGIILQNEGTFFMKGMDDTDRAKVMTVLTGFYDGDIQRIADGIKRLFPKGLEKISIDTYRQFLSALGRRSGSEKSVSAFIENKETFFMKNMDDTDRAKVITTVLSSYDKGEFQGIAERIKKLFPEGLEKISINAYLKFLKALGSKEKTTLIAENKEAFFTKDVNGTDRVKIATVLLSLYGNSIKETANGVKQLFPNGMGQTSIDTYLEIVRVLAGSNEERVSAIAQLKKAPFMKDMNDTDCAQIFLYFLKEDNWNFKNAYFKFKDVSEETIKYRALLLPKGMGQTSIKVYMEFMKALAGCKSEKKVAALVENKEMFFMKDMDDTKRAEILTCFLDRHYWNLETLEQLKQKIKYRDELLPKGVGKISVDAYMEFMNALATSETGSVDTLIQNKKTFFKAMDDTNRAEVATYLFCANGVRIQEIAEGIKKSFPEGVEKISNDTYLEFVKAIAYVHKSSVEDILQNKETFFMKNMDDTNRAEVAIQLLREPEDIENMASQIKKIFPNGIEKISNNTYLNFVKALVSSDKSSVEPLIKNKETFFAKGMDDTNCAELCIRFLELNREDFNSCAQILNEKKEYRERLLPNGMGKLSPETYMKFMAALPHISENQVEAIIKNKETFFAKEMDDTNRAEVMIVLLEGDEENIENTAWALTQLFPKEDGSLKTTYTYKEFVSVLMNIEEIQEKVKAILQNKETFFTKGRTDRDHAHNIKDLLILEAEHITQTALYIKDKFLDLRKKSLDYFDVKEAIQNSRNDFY